jgi:CO/xanthine dehydrogenase FAD-binding subunit
MKPPPFRYARPESLDDVVALLATFGPAAKLLAGGQSLVPLLTTRIVRPAVLVDLALVPELQTMAPDGDELVIGAGVTQREAETSALARDACPMLRLALEYVGHVQTRSRGTIGGSLAHADPSAEVPAVAVTLDAQLVAVGPRGRRPIAARDFFRGPYSTALEPDEVLTEVRLPIRRNARHAFVEVGRAPGSASVGVAAAIEAGNGGKVESARLTAFGIASAPLRLAKAEVAACAGDVGPAGREQVAAAAAEDVAGAAAADHGRRVVGALASRALTAALR